MDVGQVYLDRHHVCAYDGVLERDARVRVRCSVERCAVALNAVSLQRAI